MKKDEWQFFRTKNNRISYHKKCLGCVCDCKQSFRVKAIYCPRYWGSVVAEALPEHVENHIHERGTKKQPLTEEQRASNRIKSKTRCRIEHIFGFMTGSMHGITVRSVGLARAEFNIGLTNLIYNLCRFEFLNRPVKALG